MSQPRLRPRRGLLSLAIALAVSGPAVAQTPAADEDADAVQLDVVEVTTQRRVENIQDVPVAITAIGGEKLDIIGSGGEDIRFLSSRLPSLQIESSFGRAFPRFYIRGLGNTDFDLNASQPVSLVYDGVVQENPILKGFPVFDLDSLEMARGPQGTLFGRNSPAGVIKFESARPEHTPGGYFQASYGNYGSLNLEGAVTGPMGEGAAIRFSALHQERDDYVDNLANGPGDDLEGYRESAARLQMLWDGVDGFEALLNLHVRSLNGTARLFRASIIAPGSNDLQPGFDRDTVTIDGRNQQKLDTHGAGLRMRWDFDRVSLYSITGYESAKTFSRGDIDGGSVYTFPPDEPGEALFPAESADGLPRHRQLSQEFRLESSEWGRFDWQAGLFWFDESIDVESFSYNGFGGPQNGYATQVQDNTAWAVFASGEFAATDRLTVRGGLRYTDDQKDFVAERVVGPFGPPIAPISVSPEDTNVSGDLSLTFAVNEDVNVYGRIATGFRAPSVQGRLMFADASLPDDELVTVADTETVLSIEAGVKADLFNNRVRLGVAVFDYTVDDQQLTAVGGNANVARLVNADETKGRGVEVDLEAYVTDNLLVTFGASYNDTEINDPDLSVIPCAVDFCTVLDPADPNRPGAVLIDGNPLPQAPKHVYNLTARWSLPVENGEFFVFTDWAYRSEVNFFLYESGAFRGQSLLEGGVRAGYSWDSASKEVALFGRNITGEEVVVGGIDFNNLTGFLNEPRLWGVEFSARF